MDLRFEINPPFSFKWENDDKPKDLGETYFKTKPYHGHVEMKRIVWWLFSNVNAKLVDKTNYSRLTKTSIGGE